MVSPETAGASEGGKARGSRESCPAECEDPIGVLQELLELVDAGLWTRHGVSRRDMSSSAEETSGRGPEEVRGPQGGASLHGSQECKSPILCCLLYVVCRSLLPVMKEVIGRGGVKRAVELTSSLVKAFLAGRRGTFSTRGKGWGNPHRQQPGSPTSHPDSLLHSSKCQVATWVSKAARPTEHLT